MARAGVSGAGALATLGIASGGLGKVPGASPALTLGLFLAVVGGWRVYGL